MAPKSGLPGYMGFLLMAQLHWIAVDQLAYGDGHTQGGPGVALGVEFFKQLRSTGIPEKFLFDMVP